MNLNLNCQNDADKEIIETISDTWSKAEYAELSWQKKIDAILNTLTWLKNNYVDF